MKPLHFFIFCTLCFVSCQPVNHHNPKEKDKFSQISWLLGRWEMHTSQGLIMEEWTRPTVTQWQGTSYLIKPSGDTAFSEHIRLSNDDDTLHYLPVVQGQNEGKAVDFAEKSISDTEVTFENLRHDFPQRIIYKKLSDTAMVATIEGNQNGQLRREEFRYVRVR